MLSKMFLFLATIPIMFVIGCASAPTKEDPRVEQRTTHFDDLLASFAHSGKDRAELVEIGRELIEKVGQPPTKAQQSWQVEVARSELDPLLKYLTKVWKVRTVMVGGDEESRYIEIWIADRPVGVFIYEKDIVKPVNPHDIGYQAAQPWGPAIMFVCDDRRY